MSTTENTAMTDQPTASELLALTTEIVASHVSNNDVSTEELPNLIQQVYSSLASAAPGLFWQQVGQAVWDNPNSFLIGMGNRLSGTQLARL